MVKYKYFLRRLWDEKSPRWTCSQTNNLMALLLMNRMEIQFSWFWTCNLVRNWIGLVASGIALCRLEATHIAITWLVQTKYVRAQQHFYYKIFFANQTQTWSKFGVKTDPIFCQEIERYRKPKTCYLISKSSVCFNINPQHYTNPLTTNNN